MYVGIENVQIHALEKVCLKFLNYMHKLWVKCLPTKHHGVWELMSNALWKCLPMFVNVQASLLVRLLYNTMNTFVVNSQVMNVASCTF